MLGFADGWITSAFILCILSSLLCVVYGIVNWNKGGNEQEKEEDRQWAKEEEKIKEEL